MCGKQGGAAAQRGLFEYRRDDRARTERRREQDTERLTQRREANLSRSREYLEYERARAGVSQRGTGSLGGGVQNGAPKGGKTKIGG